MRVPPIGMARLGWRGVALGLPAATEVLALSCAICHLRKPKRFCLALHDRICPQCCGEQREATLDCPSECPYLQQARQHDQRREPGELPAEGLFPEVELTHAAFERGQMLIAGLVQTLGQVARADRQLKDREVIAALSKLAGSYRTLVASGLLYQEATANPAQLAILDALEQSLRQYREVERQHLGQAALSGREVLQALVFLLRLAHRHSSGRPLARGFVDFVQESSAASGEPLEGAAGSASRIILP